MDAAGRVVTAVGTAGDHLEATVLAAGALPGSGRGAAAVRKALKAAQGSGRTTRAELPRPLLDRWITPIVAGAEQLGALLLARDEPLADPDLRALERAAQVTALLLLNQRSLAEAEHRIRGELLDDLLTGAGRDPDGVHRRAALLGADLTRPHAVVVARPAAADRRRVAAAEAAALARERAGLAGEHGRGLVLLLPDPDPEAAAALVSRRLAAAAGPVTVDAAGPAAGVEGLAAAHAEASRCLRVLFALGREGQWASPRQLGVYGLLLGQAGRDELEGLVARTLGPVLAYDAARGTDLLGTLEAYFAAGGALARTAADLYIHVNTLYQRLDRLSGLLGPGWRDSDQALELQLALKVHRILRGT
jgi:sugar diacid utilization regulator